jgi:AraC-like DNA-binding protein
MAQVSVMLVRALAVAVERAGVERARFLAAAELDAALVDDSSARLPGADYGRALRTALKITGDPALGLRMGEHASAAAFDVLGHLAEHTASLRDALEMNARYSRLVTGGPGAVELREAGDRATVHFARLKGEAPEIRFTAEFATSALVRFAERVIGEDARSLRVLFAYEAPAYRDEYTRVFGGRECFEQDFTGVVLERVWLDRKQIFHSPELCSVLQTRAERMLARLELDTPVAERVKRCLASRSLQVRPSMEDVARELGMSERSLRRRLRNERVLYRALVDGALADAAKRMLADPRSSVQETAYAMGFATAPAFSRAFKRWTGLAPTAFRAARG